MYNLSIFKYGRRSWSRRS